MVPLRRILIGLDGLAPTEHVIRYAAMIGRLGCSARHDDLRRAVRCAPASSNHPATAIVVACVSGAVRSTRTDDFAEYRFVALLRHLGQVEPPPRAALVHMLNEHFTPPGPAAISCDLVKGRPLNRLPDLAADFDADLLLLDADAGSRRHCARFATEAPCPVWLVPHDVTPVLRRILVPIDFSPRSAACLRAAIQLARRFRPAKCIALHVAPQAGRLDSTAARAADEQHFAGEFADFLAGFDAHGVAIEPMFLRANRFGGALQYVTRELSVDLTILSARRRTRLAGTVLPSRAESVIRACPGSHLILKSGAKPLSLAEALHERFRETDPPQFA